MDDFGRGGRWICECGDFYDALTGCIKCKTNKMMGIMARKKELNRLSGKTSKAAKRRGRKAFHTRIINLFKLGRLKKAQKLLDGLHERSSGRWAYVNRILKKEKLN